MTSTLNPSTAAVAPDAGSAVAMDKVAEKARRLVVASERQTFDPFTEIDWSVPFEDDAYYLPPEFLPLYGTAVWDTMTPEERFAYSRHECASLCSAGIWFENILMHMLVQHLYELPATDGSHRYLLVETADECRHSSMFGEFIRRAGTPAYMVKPLLNFGGKFLKATTKGPESYIAILAAEELLDATNRATMKDERVHPTSRRIAKIHVMEEARHVSYARTYIAEVWPTLSWMRRTLAMVRAPFVVMSICDAVSNPAVYEQLGIEDGAKIAKANPYHQQRVIRDLGKLTDFLTEIGVINAVTRPLWQAFKLVGALNGSDPTAKGGADEASGAQSAGAAGSDTTIDLTHAPVSVGETVAESVEAVVGTVVEAVVDTVASRTTRVLAGTAAATIVATAWTLAGGSSGFRLS